MAVDCGHVSRPLHLPLGVKALPPTWSWSRLDDACIGIIDCPHSTPRLADTGPLIARSQDIVTGVFRVEQAAHVSESTYFERTVKATPERGDLLYSREGTYFGIAAEVPENTRVCLGQRMVLIKPQPRILNFRFLRYWLNSPLMAVHIHGFRDGTVAERLNLPTIRGLPIALPPMAEQRRIAHILGTLDDKIEINRRTSETLEAMARALFKSWFVNFDPVRAKMAGRDPGLPKDIADLFPDRLVESELGEIPEGWYVARLSDIAALITKGTTPTQQDIDAAPAGDGRVNYVRVNAIAEDGSVLREKLTSIPSSVHLGVLKRSILQPNDVLYSIAGTIGRCSIVDERLLPANTNQAVAIIRPLPHIPSAFVRLTMEHPAFRNELHQNVVHAVQANLSLGMISKARLLLPTESSLRALFFPIAQLIERVVRTRTESETLTALRDALLPNLISGELRVSELSGDLYCGNRA